MSYGQTETTGGFNASNRSRNNPPRRSNCSWKWCRGGRINAAGIFHSSEIEPDFACTSTTGGRMDKWILQADSAHQIGPETTLQSILIVVESGGTGEELPRLCYSTLQLDSLYLDSIPQLCNSTLCNSTLLVIFWCCAASKCFAVSPYCTALLWNTVYVSGRYAHSHSI